MLDEDRRARLRELVARSTKRSPGANLVVGVLLALTLLALMTYFDNNFLHHSGDGASSISNAPG